MWYFYFINKKNTSANSFEGGIEDLDIYKGGLLGPAVTLLVEVDVI